MTEQATIIGVGAVGIPVRDQDRALEFYVDKLGFEKRMDAPLPGSGGRWVMVAPRGSQVMIALVAAHDGVPAGVETGVRFVTGDAGALHDTMGARGVDVDSLLRWPGVPPMFAFRDQDGNGLEIVETPR
jgi:catechol 2,3-dioxygenase-like lactoylglutathione lyase family enzyme